MAKVRKSKTEAPETDGVDAKVNGAKLAYRLIYEAIRYGRLTPGSRITEAAFATELGLSRTPIREAMKQLEAVGLLVHEAHRGMIVRVPDHQMVTELYQVREALEGTAAGMAALQASTAEVELLGDIVEAGRRGGNLTEVIKNNAYFHNTIYRAAHNRYLLRTLAALQDSLMLLGRSTLSLGSRVPAAFDEHQAIVTAIAARDSAAAEQAARIHIRAAHKARLQLLFETEMRTSDQNESDGARS